MRDVRHRYDDPLDVIWRVAARGVGLRLTRSSDVYASTDGTGLLTLGAGDTLDADDSLAQMIFHELCHSMVQGRRHLTTPDWGLDNESDRDVVREHACLRLQAHLAGVHGLRAFLAPTTDFRAYYDALPDDVLASDGDPAVPIAREALERVDEAPWAPWVGRALLATARVVDAAHSMFTDAPSDPGDTASLYFGYVSRRRERERP